MNHAPPIFEPLIALRATGVDTSRPMSFAILHATHEAPVTTKAAPTPQARGRIVHERVITATQGLAGFDWVI